MSAAAEKDTTGRAIVGLILVAAATVYAFAVLWWWALVGMSGPVGLAHAVTIAALGTVGCALLASAGAKHLKETP